jgi:DNA-binding NtrC family response regulator
MEKELPVILIVEDRPHARLAFSRACEKKSLAVLEAENAIEARAILQSRTDIDLMFGDEQLCGSHLLSEAHGTHPFMYIILSVDRGVQKDKATAWSAPALAIQGPCDPQKLAKSIARIVR